MRMHDMRRKTASRLVSIPFCILMYIVRGNKAWIEEREHAIVHRPYQWKPEWEDSTSPQKPTGNFI